MATCRDKWLDLKKLMTKSALESTGQNAQNRQ
jgi:hypothetical protein